MRRGEHQWTTIAPLLVAFMVVASLHQATVFVSAADPSPKPLVTLCHIGYRIQISTDAMAHGLFAMDYYAPLYPNVTFRYKLLSDGGNANARQVATSVLTAQGCNAFVGPTTSSMSLVASTFVNRPWVSPTASSTELSNKGLHPWFNRVISTDEMVGRALAAAAVEKGWYRANIICQDQAYGRSVSSAFGQALRDLGGAVESIRCLSGTGEEEEALSAIREETTSRVILVAMSSEARVIDTLIRMGMDKTHIFLFTEVACELTSGGIQRVVGAICPKYGENREEAAAYRAAWLAHPRGKYTNITNDPALNLAPMINPYAISAFSMMSADSVKLLMAMFHRVFTEEYEGNLTKYQQEMSWRHWRHNLRLRDTVVNGTTGLVKLNSAGDREGSIVNIYNINPDGTQTQVGRWDSVNNYTDLLAEGQKMYFLGSNVSTSVWPSGQSSDVRELPTLLVMSCFLGAVVLLIVAITVYKLRNASARIYKRLIRSGNTWRMVMSMLAQMLDILTDVLACYVVVSSDESEVLFSVFYVGLTVLSVVGGLIEMQLALRFFLRNLSGDEPESSELAQWQVGLAKVAVLTLLIEDLPMAVIGFVAMLRQPDWVLLTSIMLSSILLGVKFRELPVVVRHLAEVAEDQEEESIDTTDILTEGSIASLATEGITFDRFTPNTILDSIEQAYQDRKPKRYEVLTRQADMAAITIGGAKPKSLEFYSIILRRLCDRLEWDLSKAQIKEDLLAASKHRGNSSKNSGEPSSDTAVENPLSAGGGSFDSGLDFDPVVVRAAVAQRHGNPGPMNRWSALGSSASNGEGSGRLLDIFTPDEDRSMKLESVNPASLTALPHPPPKDQAAAPATSSPKMSTDDDSFMNSPEEQVVHVAPPEPKET